MKLKCPLFLVVICAVLTLMTGVSCSKGDPPSPTPTPTPTPTPDPPDPPAPVVSLEFTGQYSSGRADVESNATSFAVTFNSSGNWSVTVPQSCSDWCKVSPANGSQGQNLEVQISVTENDTYDERNASLDFVCGSVRKTFVVTQKQLDAMLLASSSKVEIEEDGGNFSVKIRANVEVKCEILPQYADWIHLDDKPGGRALSDLQYSFTVDRNETAAVREGVIVFSGASTTEEVHVFQIGGNTLILTQPTVYVNPQGGRFGVELRSNCEYTYAIGEGSDWLHEDASRATSSHTVYFIADPNENIGEERSATVTFTSADGTVSALLTVVQREKGALVCGEKQIDTECVGGTFDIEYASTNGDIRFKSPHWIELVHDKAPSRAMADYKLQIKVSPNLSKTERRGYVNLALPDGSAKDSVLVTQGALEYTVTTSLKDGDFADARSHEFTIYVTSPIEPVLEASAPIKKLSDNTFRIPANHSRSGGISSVMIRMANIPVETVPVSYTSPLEPEIEDDEIAVKYGAGTAMVSIRTNTDISSSIQGSPSWIELREVKNAERGYATDTWEFDVKENTSYEPRQAVIIFSAGDFWSGTAIVTQEAAIPPIGNEGEVNVPSEGALAEMLGDELMTIDKLAINGGVNGKDVATLREMSTQGALVELDLTSTALRKDLQNQYYPGTWRPGKITEDDMIGHYMFYQTNIRSVTLPKTLKKIGYYAFNASKIEEIDIPEGVTEIDESAFRNCTRLSRVSIPGTVEAVPDYCFDGSTALSDLTLAEGIRSIGEYAFTPNTMAYTTKGELTEINLPSTLEEIGRSAFLSTKIREVTIPASVTKIGEYAFSECRHLNKVVFNCTMDTLPKRVLHNTLGITEIVFPQGLKVIGEYALDHIGMDNLTIPEGVTELMKGACNGSGKKNLVLPESLEIIRAFALGYMSMCSSFTIPSKVHFIGNRAFDGACYIKELHIKNPVPPTRDGDIFFSSFKYADCTLFVPAGSAQAYSADPYWLKFKAIVEE